MAKKTFKSTEEQRKRAKAYYEANKATCIARATKWAKEHPESVREAKKRHREANPEKAYSYVKRWKEENPERHREHTRKWRANKKKAIPFSEPLG